MIKTWTRNMPKLSPFSFGWFSLSGGTSKFFIPFRDVLCCPRSWFSFGCLRHFLSGLLRQSFSSLCQFQFFSMRFIEKFWTSVSASICSIETALTNMCLMIFDKNRFEFPISMMAVKGTTENFKHKFFNRKLLKNLVNERPVLLLLVLLKSTPRIEAHPNVTTIGGPMSNFVNVINVHRSI